MKNLIYTTKNETEKINGFSGFNYKSKNTAGFNNVYFYKSYKNNLNTGITKENLLTHEAYIQMAAGMIPDLWEICRDLYSTFFTNRAPYSALQFVPVMQKLQSVDNDQIKIFLKNSVTRHVLVENELIKIVLIHWKPGVVSNIHGHPKGGCVFKILQGKLEELRYSADASQLLLSSSGYRANSMAYIDDRLGYHAVGNPFGTSAISLHAYTPGK